jgi:vacuolar-type H+-ATPase subunit H
MKEAQSDILKKIHKAERQADGLIREAEAQARTIQAEARSKAEQILKDKKNELTIQHEQLLKKEQKVIEDESQALLTNTRDQAERLTQRVRSDIDRIVDEILKMVLTS